MCANTKGSGQKSLCEGARSSRNPGSVARGNRHQFATPRTSNQIHECAAPEPHDNVSAENTPTSKRSERDTRHKETNETIPSDTAGCCASSKTAASNLRGLPFLGRRTRVAQHGLLPVQRCPHELSPRPFPCHGQVTSKSTVALETNLVPLHGCRPPCRSRRHKALPSHFASLARDVLLMFIPSLPSCTYFRHSDRRLRMISRRRDTFQVARVATQRRPPFPQSLRWTRFRSVREIFKEPTNWAPRESLRDSWFCKVGRPSKRAKGYVCSEVCRPTLDPAHSVVVTLW